MNALERVYDEHPEYLEDIDEDTEEISDGDGDEDEADVSIPKRGRGRPKLPVCWT